MLELLGGARPASRSHPRHVGVLVPWANTVVEAELHRWGGDDVVWHYARLVPPDRQTAIGEDFYGGLLAAVPDAVDQLSALPLSQLLFACTSGSLEYQDSPVLSSGYPLIGAYEAILRVLRRAAVKEIALVTPYTNEVTEQEAASFRQAGVLVRSSACLGRVDNFDDIGRAELEPLLRTAAEPLGGASSAAVVVSCTNLHTRWVIEDPALVGGFPVVSSNLALAIAGATVV
jgi:maleate isomerase